MKTTARLSLKRRLLARIANASLSPAAGHCFGLRISPSCSEILSRRRISSRSADTDKFFGKQGKIDGFFISNPQKDVAYILSNLISMHILLVKYDA
jgi:hypothetical protein